jgi:hypothetical protein
MNRPLAQAIQPNKMTLAQISKHIEEFKDAVQYRETNPRKFYARGAFLAGLRDDTAQRLQSGWAYLEKYPGMAQADAGEHWFGLLERYEQMNDVLNEHGSDDMREHAARLIFDGIEIHDNGQ